MRTGLVFGLVALAVAATGLVVTGQDLPRSEASRVGRYVPLQPAATGVLDTASGTLYYVDPANPSEVVSLDLVGCRAFVRDVAKDASGWGAVELPKLDPAVVPARGNLYVATGPYEVLDTRTGAIYALEGPAPAGRVADWKTAKVVRTDPVLGTRATRDLHVSKRGG